MAAGRPGPDLAGDWAPLQRVPPEVFLAARENGPVPPRQLLNEARAAGTRMLLVRQRALLESLVLEPDVADEAAAELAVLLANDNQLDAAAALAEPLLAPGAAAGPVARARAVEAMGRVALWRGDGARAALGAALLQQAIEAYDRLGFEDWSGHAQMWRGYSYHRNRGSLLDAEADIRAGLAKIAPDSPRRTSMLDFLADLLTTAGRLDDADAVLDEALSLLDAGDDRGQAYLAWSRARLAAARRDAAGTARWVATVEEHLGEWFQGTSGPTFLADAAALLERVGRPADAEAYLQRAEARDPHDEFVIQAQAELLARRGDPEAAIAELRRLSTQPWLEAAEMWRHRMLEAWAAFRAGRGDVGTIAANAFAQAEALGGVAVAAVGEPELSLALAPVAAAAGSAAAASLLSPRTGVLVRLLGQTEIRRGIEPVRLASESAGPLVRLLAVSPAGLDAAEVADLLWPGSASPPRQLRQRLSRLAGTVGELVTREGTRLALVDAWVDVRAFTVAAERALRSGSEQDLRLALTLWTGDPLPADPYAPWAAEVRDRSLQLRVRLLDLGAALAAARGATTEAVALLEDAAELDPYDIQRLERAAGLLEAAGQQGAAARRRAQVARRLAEID